MGQAADDTRDRVGALHCRGREDDFGERPAALEHMADIVEDGAARRCDNADSCRKSGEGALPRLIEQALRLELRLQPFELHLQQPGAFGLHEVDDELQVAALLIEAGAAVHDDGAPVIKLARCGGAGTVVAALEEDAAHRPAAVLQREVDVA